MNIFKYFKKRSEDQFKINSSINIVEKNNVVYAAYYKNMGNGYSSVECTITTPLNSQKHSFSIDTKIPNKLIKNGKPVILPVSNEEKDFVVFAFPEERKQSNTEFSIISYATYQVNLEPSSIDAIPHGKKMSLSNNAKLSHSSNKYHNYSKPKAMELPNGDIIIAAIDSNSEGQYVTAWLLKKEQGLEFNVNKGSRGVVSRLLFKVDENVESSFQLLPSSQNDNVGKIIYSDSTSLFSLDVTKSMIDNIREGKYVNNEDEECLFAVGKERCDQYYKKVSDPFLTGSMINNLSAVNTENGAVVAFLENEQQLCLAKLTGKKGKKQIVHNYKEKIKSLQLSVIGENDIIVSATGEKNITQSTIDSEKLNVVATKYFPTDEVKTLDDFVNIIYNNPLKLTTLFPYVTSSTPKISSSTISTTTPLATEEITTRGSMTTVEGDTTSAATTQRTTTEQKTTGYTTATTTVPTTQPTTTASPKTTASTKVSTESTTNQASTTKPTTKPTKATAKSTVRPTSSYATSTARGSSSPKSTTTEMQSTTVLGLTTLASTIGSAVVTILGSVTQNVTNMITTNNNSIITDSSSNFNQTDVSSNYEEKLLNTAWITAAIAVPITGIGIVIGGICFYKHRNKNRMGGTPSDITDEVGSWQYLGRLGRRFRSCFNGQGRTVPELQLDVLDGDRISNDDDEINQDSLSNSRDDLLKQNQSGATYSTFASANNANSEAGRSRSGSEKSTNSDGWDHQGDTNSVQYKEEDEISHKGDDVSLELNDVTVRNGVDQSSQIKISDSLV